MKISKINITNFRSIERSEFSVTDFNIFVGQNNCGKTNFFEAIEFCCVLCCVGVSLIVA